MTLPFPAQATGLQIQPRPYQSEATEALDAHVCSKETNPCVVIPTGGGKSILIAWIIQKWKSEYPPFRVCILAHRKELVEQNAQELIGLWPGADVGIYSAGLGFKNEDNSILFASIDSVWNKAGIFPPFNVIIIDEAHRIPAKGEGKYRKFIQDCKIQSKNLRVIGFTATPFRMGCGPICHKDHILHEICYEANVGDLIRDGYLCKLRSKIGDVHPDLQNVKRNSGGDYIVDSLAKAVDKNDVVSAAIQSAMRAIIAEQRKSIIFFCVDENHCKHVSAELRKYGIDAPTVTAKTPSATRDRIAKQFKLGELRAICNINVYTEGFNAKCVDCVVLLRPTLSKSLYVQMVGRGFRLFPSKENCLVLDYAGCIEEHGPIDCIEVGDVALATCQKCGDVFSRAIRICPNCGWEIPKQEIERAEAEERERKMHAAQASQRSILSEEPEILVVSDVSVHRHVKPGKPDSIRIQYRCGLSVVNDWVCLEHGGYAEQRARYWWKQRKLPNPEKIMVNEALADMFLSYSIKNVTKTITVKRNGKHNEIIGYGLGN